MLTVEKVLILRSVPIFERTPDHILSELATILKEVDLDQDVQFISEGDVGDCMFVIVDGAVKVHRGDELLAELGSRDIVGEMSVLDPEPRSASVTTTRPTRVLRIDRDDFFELMADRIEIAQGILGVLCQRLRGLGSRPLSLLPPGSGTSSTY
jgi:CRP-like cAMP-binding protein